ncbi:hypothetical protein EGW08_002359 [Elysia chlorotica]|uniref:G-protein coupled receptors family 1 profile domain-containing protein n=1 Tax=Elysia chlorotica TaxID=188477 RepID=A0A433U7X5_ELYCH|nr:hypothetical protein EGW08_002359 [Elysia chlorotica]
MRSTRKGEGWLKWHWSQIGSCRYLFKEFEDNLRAGNNTIKDSKHPGTLCFKMCFDEAFGVETPAIDALYSEIHEVISSLQFMFWINGVVLPVILCFGFVMNVVCLIVIIRGSGWRAHAHGVSSPHRLLTSLLVCDLLIMAMSVYSDVEPAIRAKHGLEKIRNSILPDCEAVLDLKAKLEFLKNNNNSAFGIGENFFLSDNFGTQNNTNNYTVPFGNKRDTPKTLNTAMTNDDLMLLLLYSLLTESESETEANASPIPDLHSTHNILHDSSHIGTKSYDFQKELNIESNKTSVFPALTTPTKRPNNPITASGKNITSFPKSIFTTDQTTSTPAKSRSRAPTVSALLDNIFTTDQATSTRAKPRARSSNTPAPPLRNITINSRPMRQAAERWVAYSLMTFNLGLVLTLTVERWAAIKRPFWARLALTPRHASCSLLALAGGTLALHTPQFVREVVMVTNERGSLRDDFQGKMLQSFRRPYELTVVYVTSGTLALTLVLSCLLLRMLSAYMAKSRRHRQPGNTGRIDTPQAVTMITLTFMSLEDLVNHTTAFTRTVTVVRLLYVTNSALAHSLTYCLMTRQFRRRLHCDCCNGRWCSSLPHKHGAADSGQRMVARSLSKEFSMA